MPEPPASESTPDSAMAKPLAQSRWFIALGPIVISLTAAVALRSFEERQKLVEHTIAVIEQVQRMRQLALEGEIQARNSIRLEGRIAAAYRAQADSSFAQMNVCLRELLQLTSDNEVQQKTIIAAQSSVDEYSRFVLSSAPTRDVAQLMEINRRAEVVREVCDSIERDERALLRQRLAQRDETQRWLSAAFVAAVLTNIVSLAWGYVQMRRYHFERNRSEASMKRTAAELERRVADRTAELRATVEQLERSNADLERFAYSASHDLQEPLRIIGSYVSLLGRRYQGKLDADADRYIAYAVDGACRMQDLVNGLLQFSTLQADTFRWAETPLQQPLEEALRYLGLAIEQADARVRVEPLPLVYCDPKQIELVFRNLIANSLKFAAPGRHPEITVSAETRPSQCVIQVKDNGLGFEPEYARQVFEVFARLHPRGRYPGTGTGLAIARRIVELHGGKIWAEPEKGIGTSVFFSLPIFGAKPSE
jgi:signal transduction histidine kinase